MKVFNPLFCRNAPKYIPSRGVGAKVSTYYYESLCRRKNVPADKRKVAGRMFLNSRRREMALGKRCSRDYSLK